MPSVVATIKVKEDKVEEAKRFLKQLAADTLAKEKGTLAYRRTRGRTTRPRSSSTRSTRATTT